MTNLELKDVNMSNIDVLVNLCIPVDRRDDSRLIEGYTLKKKWAERNVRKYGSIGKLAYLDSQPVGMIQYTPNIDERLIDIRCIFVPEKEHHRIGVGKALLEALIEDMRSPKHFFDNNPPFALVTWTFDVPGWFSQQKFFLRGGFQLVSEDNPFLLYYPIQEGFVYVIKDKDYIPQEEDRGKAIVFINPSCPFCVSFTEGIKELIRKVTPETPIRVINQFDEPVEVEKRGKISFCIVNNKPIESFFTERESFLREVKEAISDKNFDN